MQRKRPIAQRHLIEQKFNQYQTRENLGYTQSGKLQIVKLARLDHSISTTRRNYLRNLYYSNHLQWDAIVRYCFLMDIWNVD